MTTLDKLRQELRYAVEGLEQMQQPEAGYFEDFKNKQDWEYEQYNRDIKAQCKGIERLERQITRLERQG